MGPGSITLRQDLGIVDSKTPEVELITKLEQMRQIRVRSGNQTATAVISGVPKILTSSGNGDAPARSRRTSMYEAECRFSSRRNRTPNSRAVGSQSCFFIQQRHPFHARLRLGTVVQKTRLPGGIADSELLCCWRGEIEKEKHGGRFITAELRWKLWRRCRKPERFAARRTAAGSV